MKSVFPVLFAVSLLGNVALGYFVYRTTSTPLPAATGGVTATASAGGATKSADATSTSAAVTASAKATGGTIISGTWRTPRTDDDMRALVANMRAAGCPPAILRAVVDKLVAEKFAADRPEANLPYWKQLPRTAENVAADLARDRESKELRESILGADSSAAARLDPIERQRRFGSLSDEKINELLRVDREYRDIGALASVGMERNMTMEGFQERRRQQEALAAERQADLAAVLSPEELAQYEMRVSAAAGKVMSGLRTVDVTEEEYAALYQAQKAYDAANPDSAMMGGNADTMAQRLAAQAKLQEQNRAILGDDRFFTYLEGADRQFGEVTQFTKKYPAITTATAYAIYQLRNEAMNPGNIRSQEEFMANRANMAARLDALLTPEVAAEFKKQNAGRVFNLPTSARPALRLPGGGG